MKLCSKTFKLKKLNFLLKKKKLILFFNLININTINWINIEQKLKKNNILYYKIYNTLALLLIKNSLFKNIKFLINSTIIFFSPYYYEKTFSFIIKKVLDISHLYLNCLCIKVNNILYYASQLNNIVSFKYIKNIFIFFLYLKNILKFLISVKFFILNKCKLVNFEIM